MAQYEGKVQWFNNAKRYGFLSRNDCGADVFVHFSSIHAEGYKTLKDGDLVSFSIITGDKGKPQAADVQLLINESIPPATLTASDIERGE